ncbi:LPXTG cell wall anchor domain-containing protein [Agrilactobacillus composti]|uniref:LPXTG cell wall anchor domain-containing protein n=1 Tax=Agrilactobacillus composti TaxID=398555 RepID=UPI001267912A|nr:LPXTG cell wall anchor domain-containing protein [Agrilactobacillus composti]
MVGTTLANVNVAHAADDTGTTTTAPAADTKATSTTNTPAGLTTPATNNPASTAPSSTSISSSTSSSAPAHTAGSEAPAGTTGTSTSVVPSSANADIQPAAATTTTAAPTNTQITATPAAVTAASAPAQATAVAPTSAPTPATTATAAKADPAVAPTVTAPATNAPATAATNTATATPVAPTSDATTLATPTATPAATPTVTPVTATSNATVNAIASDVRLLTGQTTKDAPATATYPVSDFVRYGAAGKFTVNTSDLVNGNTIVVAPVALSTNVPGALPNLQADGIPVSISTPDGAAVIGVGQFDNKLKAITLKVNKTITSNNPQMGISFSDPWLMVLNYRQDIPRLNPLAPFTNKLDVSGHTYEVNFDPQIKKAATIWPDGFTALGAPRANGVTLEITQSTIIPNSEVLNQLQASGGASGDVLPNDGVTVRYAINSSDDILAPHQSYLDLKNLYVSAADNKAQTIDANTEKADFSTDASPTKVSDFNLGDGLSLTQVTKAATGTGTYYSKQADGSYLTVVHVTPADLVLKPDQIRAGVTTRYNGISNLNDDVQATQKYYAGVMQNVASRIYGTVIVGAVDPSKPITVTVNNLDAAGNVTSTLKQTSLPNTSDAVANSSQVTTHFVDLKGNPLDTINTQYGLPTAKETLTGPTSTKQASVSPKGITGYKVVADPSTLTTAQQQALQDTLTKLGLSSSTPDQVIGQNVFVTKAANIAFPGLSGTSYDAAGNIVTDGSGTPGTGQTNAYYAYSGLPKNANIHWINLADSKQTSDLTPASGTENTALAQTFAGFVGDSLKETLSGALPAKTHLVEASNGIDTTNSAYTLSGIYNTDTTSPQNYYIYYAQDPETTTPGTTTPGTTTPGTTTPGTTTPGTTTPGTTTPGTTTPGTTTPGTTTPGTTTPGTTTPGTTTPGTTTPGKPTTPGTTIPGKPTTPGKAITPVTPTTPNRPTAPGATTPSKPANPGTAIPGRPVNPNAPLTPITPTTINTPITPSTPTNLVTPTTPTKSRPTANRGTTTTPSQLSNPSNTGVQAKATASAKLPQTGEANDRGLMALGIAVLGSALIALAYFRRRKLL